MNIKTNITIETKYLGTNKINVPWAPAGKLARQ